MSSCGSLGIGGLPGVRSERLNTSRNEGANGGRTASQDQRDLVLGKVLVVAEDDGCALALRKPTESVDDGMAIDRVAFWTWGRLGLDRTGEESPLDRSTPEMVLRKVHHGPAEVGVERAGIPQVPEVSDNADERILGDVLGYRTVSCEEIGEPNGARSGPLIKVGELARS
jgi:hypothetical protein